MDSPHQQDGNSDTQAVGVSSERRFLASESQMLLTRKGLTKESMRAEADCHAWAEARCFQALVMASGQLCHSLAVCDLDQGI